MNATHTHTHGNRLTGLRSLLGLDLEIRPRDREEAASPSHTSELKNQAPPSSLLMRHAYQSQSNGHLP